MSGRRPRVPGMYPVARDCGASVVTRRHRAILHCQTDSGTQATPSGCWPRPLKIVSGEVWIR